MARVLLVDDDPDIREMTALRMQVDGHHVMTAASAEEALAKTEQSRYDVALLDVHMPGVNGLELLELLRAAESTRHLPVVFYTASATAPAAVHGLSLADPLLTRGQPLTRLLATLSSLSGR